MVNAGSWYIGSQIGKTVGKLLIQSAEREAWEEFADLVLQQKEEEEKERRMEIQRQRQIEIEMENYRNSSEYKERIAKKTLNIYNLYSSELKKRITFDELFEIIEEDAKDTTYYEIPEGFPYIDSCYYYIALGLQTRDLFFEALGEYYKLNNITKSVISKFNFINTYIMYGRKDREDDLGLEYEFNGALVKKNTNYAIDNIYIENNYYDNEEEYYYELLDDYFIDASKGVPMFGLIGHPFNLETVKGTWNEIKKLPFDEFKLLFGTLVKDPKELYCYDLELLESIRKEYVTLEELFNKKEENLETTNACSKCGSELNGDFDFCPYCGTPKSKVSYCQKCHRFYENFDFCPNCGTKLISKGEYLQQAKEKIREYERRDPDVNYDYFEPDNITCPSCGHEHEYETDYCEVCGVKMDDGFFF